MFTSTKGSKILDTVLLTENGFHLKTFHIQRTFEAYLQANQPVLIMEIAQLYNQLEKQLLEKIPQAGSGFKEIVRLLFPPQSVEFEFQILEYKTLSQPIKLQVMKTVRMPSGLGLQNFKWDLRAQWDDALRLKKPEADDIISVNDKNEVVETSRFNLFFFAEKKGEVYTPPLSSGCINGVFRRWAFEHGQFPVPGKGEFPLQEKIISAEEISLYQVFPANSVRGVVTSEVLSI